MEVFLSYIFKHSDRNDLTFLFGLQPKKKQLCTLQPCHFVTKYG